MDDVVATEIRKALSHPLRLEYLRALLKRRELSPSEYARDFDEPLDKVAYRDHALHGAGVVGFGDDPQTRPVKRLPSHPRRMARHEPFGVLRPEAWAVGEIRVGGAPVATIDLDPDMVDVRPDRHRTTRP